MSNPRESREQDARAGSFDMAQATASGGMVAVVAVILLASWILKADPRPRSSSVPTPASATTRPPSSVLAPLTAVTDETAAPVRAAVPDESAALVRPDASDEIVAPPVDRPLAAASIEPARSSPLVERAMRDAGRIAARRGAWTAQVAAVCNEDLVASHVRRLGDADRLYILPVTIKERSCYRILWGTYDSAAAAAKADLPSALKSPEKLRVLGVEELLR